MLEYWIEREADLPPGAWSWVVPILPAGASTLALALESDRGPEILSTPCCRVLGAICEWTLIKGILKKKIDEGERLRKGKRVMRVKKNVSR